MQELVVGDFFRFSRTQSGIVFSNRSLLQPEYGIPAEYYRRLYQNFNFKDEIIFGDRDHFIVVSAVRGVNGYKIKAQRLFDGTRVVFFQGNSDSIRLGKVKIEIIK